MVCWERLRWPGCRKAAGQKRSQSFCCIDEWLTFWKHGDKRCLTVNNVDVLSGPQNLFKAIPLTKSFFSVCRDGGLKRSFPLVTALMKGDVWSVSLERSMSCWYWQNLCRGVQIPRLPTFKGATLEINLNTSEATSHILRALHLEEAGVPVRFVEPALGRPIHATS